MAQKGYGYRYLEEIISGDAAFEVYAEDLDRLFELSAEAMFGIMTDLKSIVAEESEELKLESSSLEELLYLYLSELIYLKDVQSMIYSKFDVAISGEYILNGVVGGQRAESLKQPPSIDIKAVTYYRFKIQKVAGGYRAVVVIDL